MPLKREELKRAETYRTLFTLTLKRPEGRAPGDSGKQVSP